MREEHGLILVVDDEPKYVKLLVTNLKMAGYDVLSCDNGYDALQFIEDKDPDLVLLDLRLPGLDGYRVCQTVRNFSPVPIIMLTAMDRQEDKILGLDSGADDYLSKPFGMPELLARVRAALRRSRGDLLVGTDSLQCGSVTLNPDDRTVHVANREMHLTKTEWNLMLLLIQNCGKVLLHEVILTKVWGPQYAGETEYLRVYVRRLREKLEEDPAHPRILLTEPGVGYILRSRS